MALLVDKHRPRSLDALSYHPELSERLRALVRLHRCTQKPASVASLTIIITGRERRLPTFAYLWPFWCGKEDENLGDVEGALWSWC